MARTCRVGVHGRNADRFEDADYQVVRDAKLETLKMMSLTNVDVFQRLKGENPDLQIITRLHHHGFNTGGHPSPEEFVSAMAPVMAQLQPYCTDFQVHNEPNHVHRYEGWGNTDDDARSFNAWFLDVYGRLKREHSWARLGFPGLAVPDPLHRDKAWLQICKPAIERADWLGCHCYWQTPPNGGSVMMADHSGLCFKYYHQFFPNKVIHILECGNSNGQGQGFSTDEHLYGNEYEQWLAEVFKYPYIGSAAFFILSSPDPTWDTFAWRTSGSIKGGIVGKVGNMARPELVPVQVAQPAPAPAPATETGNNGATPSALPIKVGHLPDVVTHQHIIDSFYHVAYQLGLGNWEVMKKTGLDVKELAKDRQSIYSGTSVVALPNLSTIERRLLLAELIGQLRKARKSAARVNAPGGLNMRHGPTLDQEVLLSLENGKALDVIHKEGDWLFVATDECHAGYVHCDYVAQSAPAQPVAQPAIQRAANPTANPTISVPEGSTVLAQPGYLASTPALISAPLAGEQFALGPNAGPGARLLTSIWGRYGGLLTALAGQLSIDPALAVAIVAVESGGNTFGPDGRMLIRFENHLFDHYWGKQNAARFAQHFTYNSERTWEGHMWRSDPGQAFAEFHGNQSAEWSVLNFACGMDETAAKFSISMGLPQIMGFNHQRIGYATVQEMFNAFQGDERNHVLGLFDFIRADTAMLQALRNNDYRAFAAGYNGPGQADYYGGLIQKWVQSFNILRQDPSSVSFSPRSMAETELADELDAAISFLPMPLPSAIFAQSQPAAVATQPALVSPAVQGGAQQGTPPTEAAEELPQIALPEKPMDDRLYALWLEHIENGFVNNNVMFTRVLRAFMVPYYMTVVMYAVMFTVGIGLFVVAAWLSSREGTQLAGLFFGGLGVASFLGYFLSKPLRSLEENLQFITWLGIVYNTYWTRLLYMQDAETVQEDLRQANAEAVEQIEHMLNKNVEVAYKRPEAQGKPKEATSANSIPPQVSIPRPPVAQVPGAQSQGMPTLNGQTPGSQG